MSAAQIEATAHAQRAIEVWPPAPSVFLAYLPVCLSDLGSDGSNRGHCESAPLGDFTAKFGLTSPVINTHPEGDVCGLRPVSFSELALASCRHAPPQSTRYSSAGEGFTFCIEAASDDEPANGMALGVPDSHGNTVSGPISHATWNRIELFVRCVG